MQKLFDEIRENPWKRAPGFGDGAYNETTGFRGELAKFTALFAECPAFGQLVKGLWGSESVWYYDHELFHKVRVSADSDRGTPFHRDTSSVPYFGNHLANIWIPLEDKLPKQHCLEVVRGSYKTSSKFKEIQAMRLETEKQELASWDL